MRLTDEQRELAAGFYPNTQRIVRTMTTPALPPVVEYEDLLGAATMGLMKAAARWDPSRGVKFSAYAQHRVRGAVLDKLKHLRYRNARRPLPLDDENLHLDPPYEVDPTTELVREDVHAMVARLPEQERDAVERRFFSGLNYQQAADALGVDDVTMLKRLRSAYSLLQERLS